MASATIVVYQSGKYYTTFPACKVSQINPAPSPGCQVFNIEWALTWQPNFDVLVKMLLDDKRFFAESCTISISRVW